MQLTYDSLSRVTGETQGPNPLGSSGKTVSYSYDAEGNRAKIDYPDGFGGSAFDANESRDALGRLSSVTDGGSNQIAAFDLYGAGARKKKATLASSTTANYARDGFRRPTDIDRGVIKFSRAGPIGKDTHEGRFHPRPEHQLMSRPVERVRPLVLGVCGFGLLEMMRSGDGFGGGGNDGGNGGGGR